MTSNRLPVLADEIRKAHAEVGAAMATAAERAITAGHLLIEAKELAGHGEWLPYLKALGIPPRTAQRYMTLAASGCKSATVAHLGIGRAERFIALTVRCLELAAELQEFQSLPKMTRSFAAHFTELLGTFLATVVQLIEMVSHRDDCPKVFSDAMMTFAENGDIGAAEATVKALLPPELLDEAA
jgi:hypothetical protein